MSYLHCSYHLFNTNNFSKFCKTVVGQQIIYHHGIQNAASKAVKPEIKSEVDHLKVASQVSMSCSDIQEPQTYPELLLSYYSSQVPILHGLTVLT